MVEFLDALYAENATIMRGDIKIIIPDLSVSKSKSLLIKGRSGVGKTSMLYGLCGLLKLSSGEVKFKNQIINSTSKTMDNLNRAKLFSIIFADFKLLEGLNVIDNIKAQALAIGTNIKPNELNELMEELEISSITQKSINKISQGQKQRVAIARAIIAKPKIIIADEPSSALDVKNAKSVMNALKNFQLKNNAILIAASHDEFIDSYFDYKINLENDSATSI